jgi:carbon-monoxide dehydrogenase small subunit
MRVELSVNEQAVATDVESRVTLADFLRETLHLTGTHLGCEQGVCGSCTVVVDGGPVRSCLMFAVQAHGSHVRTVEGLAAGEALHPLQEAFHDAGGLQCGFCTAGLLMTALPLYERGMPITRQEIREAIAGNLCRCTGYAAIVESIARAIEGMHAS